MAASHITMIAELLNDEFLLAAAENTRLELKAIVEKRERREALDAGPLREISDAEIREVIDELDRVVREREATEPQPQQSSLYMPREPILAILQSELERAVEEQRPEELAKDPEGPTDRRFSGDEGQRGEDGRRAFGRYEVTRPRILSDPRWLWSGVVIAWHKLKQKADFAGLPDRQVQISEEARLLLVGDWGSGLKRAQAVALRMRELIEQGIAEGREQHVIHLGDVYYTGAEWEYEQKFLRYWPVRAEEGIGSYTLCGNHDMYRGGHAYYATALADPRFSRQARKSVFALSNTNWQLLGLDSAYEDGRLHGGQPEWVAKQLEGTPHRRTVLLSHHQLWSAYEHAGAGFTDDLGGVLASGQIDAWFWGHEHRCLVYEATEQLPFSCCLGHGGIPEYLIKAEASAEAPALRYSLRKRHGAGIEPWGTFGFAVLDLDGREMRVRYIDEDGELNHQEVIGR